MRATQMGFALHRQIERDPNWMAHTPVGHDKCFGFTPASALQAGEQKALDPAIAAVAGIEIALPVCGDDVQAEELAGISADMAEGGGGDFRQRLAIQHSDRLVVTLADI